MKGCDTCSGLVYVGDAFCPTCGAEVEKVRTRADQVTIPLRRHGRVPPPPPALAIPPDAGEDRRLSIVLAVLFALISAGWLGAAVYWIA